MNERQLAKFKIILTFVSLSILTCGLPTFVMQAVTYYKISHSAAGSLESYQNLTRIALSFVMFAVLMKVGYRKSLMVNYAVLLAFCFFIPFVNSIWMIRGYLVLIGISNVVLKVVAYSSVGLVTDTKEEHASFINLMEGIYTFGSFGGMWMFSYFLEKNPALWTYAFWVICALCFILLLFWTFTPFDESNIQEQEKKPILTQFKEVLTLPLVTLIIFLILFACYESLEQGVGSWLAAFYNQILDIPKSISVQLASLFTLGLGLGRLIGAVLTRYISWYKYFFINFIISLILIAVTLSNIAPSAGANASSIFNAPLIAYGLPVLGILIGPVYPTLVSLMITSLPKGKHALMISLVMIAGAIFDSGSSKILGILFGSIGGVTAFAIVTGFTICVLIVLILPFAKLTHSDKENEAI